MPRACERIHARAGARLYGDAGPCHAGSLARAPRGVVSESGPRSVAFSGSASRIAWTRTSGVAALVSNSGSVHAPDTGAVLAPLRWHTYGQNVAVSRDGTRVCTADVGMAPYGIHCGSLDGAVGVHGATVVVGPEQSRHVMNAFGGDQALAPDGARLYAVDGSLALSSFDATASALPAVASGDATTTAWLGALALDPDGRVHAGGRASTGTATLFGWDAAGHLRGSLDAGEIVARGLAISGDGLRAVAVTVPADRPVDRALTFVTLP